MNPLDNIDAGSLLKAPLLMIAQPRGLAPDELVALDDWVRSGGKAIIFADPLLVWPSRYALGDVRRAPPVTLLDPLLAHWGIELESPPGNAPLVATLSVGDKTGSGAGMGLLTSTGGSCRPSNDQRWIDCKIGAGHVILVGDADILDFATHPENTSIIDSLLALAELR